MSSLLFLGLVEWPGPILKERLFGLTNTEGNHGEDVKECYFYLDATPTSSYLKALYKYPQAEFPYAVLVEENRRRSRKDPEFELLDTGVFDDHRYFDVFVEYAKSSPNDILIRVTAANRGPEAATLHLLPTVWFRNTWSWGCRHEGCTPKPKLRQAAEGAVFCQHPTLGQFHFCARPDHGGRVPALLFTDNHTNNERLFQAPNESPHVKDAFHDYVIHGQSEAVNSAATGTKAAAHYVLTGLWTRRTDSTTINFKSMADGSICAFVRWWGSFRCLPWRYWRTRRSPGCPVPKTPPVVSRQPSRSSQANFVRRAAGPPRPGPPAAGHSFALAAGTHPPLRARRE